MIGIWASYSNIFLYIAGVAMLIAYGLPLIIVPLRWAKVFGWRIPQDANLTVILGQSLGIAISLIAAFAFKAANTPAAKPFFFDMMLWLLGAMTILHVYGALWQLQPIRETLEIILWVVLFLLTLCCTSSEHLRQKLTFAKRHFPGPKPLYFHCQRLQILQASCL